jgi:putative hydrolase of the HAD superfamily
MKNIIFDVGMVLIDFHWRKTMEDLSIPEEAIRHLETNMINHPLWRHLDLDDMPEEEIISTFKEISPEYAHYIDLFFDNIEAVIDMYPGTDLWLKSLKERGYKIYLLSNYPRRLFALHTPRYHFLPYVDGKVVSYEYHVVKPNPQIYEILCDKYGLLPEESIFLDDRQENLDAAGKLGFSTILVTDQESAKRQLEEILNSK